MRTGTCFTLAETIDFGDSEWDLFAFKGITYFTCQMNLVVLCPQRIGPF